MLKKGIAGLIGLTAHCTEIEVLTGAFKTFQWSDPMISDNDELTGVAFAARTTATTNSALEAENEELQSFAYAASHDLRSPIQTMCSLLDLLEEDYHDTLPEDVREIVGRLSGLADRMVQMSDGVLDYVRISGAPIVPAPFDCDELIEGVIANLDAEIRIADARIEVGPMPCLIAIRPQIGQILQNLVSNALKFRVRGRPCRITLTAREIGGFHEFTISDNGIGLSTDEAESIFAPFHRLHGRNSFAGSGLGLTICRKIVTAHGGRIWAECREGPGTSFIFVLPGVSDV